MNYFLQNFLWIAYFYLLQNLLIMLKETLPGLFERELNKLKEDLNLYKDESTIWQLRGTISNSAGNLCLHLIGNLEHFIGATLGRTGYIRKREEEFALKNIPRIEMLNSIDHVIDVINTTLSELHESDFNKKFPLEKHGEIETTEFMMLHLLAHLNYHLGQINYHRRLIN